MRTAFVETLCELAQQDERIWVLTGDLGYSVLERFIRRFPDRFVNVGVAEQNMTGVAAGLALCGKVVFTYSIANFPIMRCLEQIRNDVCYHNLNVKIVAVGGGLAYGSAGYTHHAVEDLAVMRAMPNMTVIAPGDPVETRLATKAVVNWLGPCYLRLGKAGEPVVHGREPDFEIGKGIVVRAGIDVTFVSSGGMLKTTLEAAQMLSFLGIQARVLSMATIKPVDRDMILAAARETKNILSVEEHSIIGGLGSTVAEVLAEAGIGIPFRRLGLPEGFNYQIGSRTYLLGSAGLSAAGLVAAAKQLLRVKGGLNATL